MDELNLENEKPRAYERPFEEKTSKTLSYQSYLKINELISLQKPLSNPVEHDELLFIVVHQVYELWFKQLLFEVNSVIKSLKNNDPGYSMRLLDRICQIFKVLIKQIDILETMTPVEFNRFRSNLNPASGFQSFQFRLLELLSGASKKRLRICFDMNPDWKDKIIEHIDKPTLHDAFEDLLRHRGLFTKDRSLQDAVLEAYRNPDQGRLRDLCELLIQYDEQMVLWRFRHIQMVERMIGLKSGTGGSPGVSYLKSTLSERFFPELWAVRTQM